MTPSLSAYTQWSGTSSGLLGLVTEAFRILLGMPLGGVGEGEAWAGSLPFALLLLGRTTSSSSSVTSSTRGAGDLVLALLRRLLRPRGSEDVSLSLVSFVACWGVGRAGVGVLVLARRAGHLSYPAKWSILWQR